MIEAWRQHNNAVRPHVSLGWRSPAPKVLSVGIVSWPTRSTLIKVIVDTVIH